ncbi:MAG: hypothetical protein RSG77_19510 [Hafnia sp.]
MNYGFEVGSAVNHVKDIGGEEGIVIEIDADHDLGDVTTCRVVWGAKSICEARAAERSDSSVHWTNKLALVGQHCVS